MLLAKATTELNADCVEFCPCSLLADVLAVGCYELDEQSRERKGRVLIFNAPSSLSEAAEFKPVAEIALLGVLDIKWSPTECSRDGAPLGVAAADGRFILLNVTEKEATVVASCEVSSGLLLAADWTRASRILSATSDGHLANLVPAESTLRLDATWRAHELETWCVTADRFNEHVVYSGSDDCSFKAWDLRSVAQEPVLVFADRKSHGAGVCAIASDPHAEHRLCTGSYDEYLRLWDTRLPNRPLLKQQARAAL